MHRPPTACRVLPYEYSTAPKLVTLQRAEQLNGVELVLFHVHVAYRWLAVGAVSLDAEEIL